MVHLDHKTSPARRISVWQTPFVIITLLSVYSLYRQSIAISTFKATEPSQTSHGHTTARTLPAAGEQTTTVPKTKRTAVAAAATPSVTEESKQNVHTDESSTETAPAEPKRRQEHVGTIPETTPDKEEEPKRPNTPLNIVFFYADDWTARTLGKINKSVKTPNIDAMADRGMRFTHSCVTSSICWVSRATLNTGVTFARHRMVNISSDMMYNRTGPWKETLYPLLRQAGYHTGFIGKWHHPLPHEFMEYSFDYRKFYYGAHWKKRDGKRIHVTDCNEMDAINYLRNERPRNNNNNHTNSTPFALTVSFTATHSMDGQPFPLEYQPKNTSMGWYENDTMSVPQTATIEHWNDMPWFFHKKENEAHLRYKRRYGTYEKFQVTMKNYYRMATEVDVAIGNIIQELKDQGVYDNTLLVFTSDNGMFHGEHQLAGKWFPHEESIRVPLVVQDPRMPRSQWGRTNDDFALNIDLAPTFLSAAGVKVPPRMQGRDIAPLYLDLTGEAGRSWRKDFFYEWSQGENEAAVGHTKGDRLPAVFGLIRKDYKYFYWPKQAYGQLFHVSEDPFEEYDVFNATLNSSATLLQEIQARYAYMKNRSQGGAPL